MSATLEVDGGRPLVGELPVPGDKSISHRALLLAALAPGHQVITGLSRGEDVARTLDAVEALGATVRRAGPDRPEDGLPGGEGTTVTVEGGRDRLASPDAPLDLGNSGTGLRLLAGVVATLPGTTVLDGDASLRTRPMDRVAVPLGAMGAACRGRGERLLPPFEVDGGSLVGIEYTPPVASAQVKSAVLLAGLDASGETVVHEPVATRAHTEEMLAAMGADITVERSGGGVTVRLRPSSLRPRPVVAVPGDPSQAAFWVVAGLVVPDSRITVTGVHLGTERVGFVGVLRRMGADVGVTAADGDQVGDLTARATPLVATDVQAAEIPSLDEVPVLAVAAAVATGTTRFHDVGELRVKESDRLAGTADLVRAFGAHADVVGDDLLVTGVGTPERLRPGRVAAAGDHRMAMAAAVAGSACPPRGRGDGGPTVVTGWETVASSYPGFADRLGELGAGCEVR